MINLIDKILLEGEIMIYSKMENKYVEFIYYRKWSHPLGSSGINFHFPSDSIFLERTLFLGL